ncbi:MAG: hypothetical protein J1F65_06200 [Clostridiales bacterium]|nr:hypothetical protein [Clostridiales bacterium]
MKKLLSSKLFVILTPIIVLVVGIAAAVLLSLQPNVYGNISGGFGLVKTQYVFSLMHACAYSLLAVVLSCITLLLCAVLRKLAKVQDRAE